MLNASDIGSILRSDPVRWRLLALVSGLNLPDCWIAAGFVRNAVWDALHGRSPQPPQSDVDVIWYDPGDLDPERDRSIERELLATAPLIAWSVKNQARMHRRNADGPYQSAIDAMRYWPETATAIAARRIGSDQCEIASPLGLDDLADLILRPTPRFTATKRKIFDERIESKGWLTTWPRLKLAQQ